MSLVNAVHTLLEVAAGRLNLTPQAADELHAAISAEQDAAKNVRVVPDPTPSAGPSISATDPSLPPTTEAGASWQS